MMPLLNRAQRLVLVVALGATLYVFGQWLTSLGSNLPIGSANFVPLSDAFPLEGLHPWVRLALWLVLIAIWAIASMALLRSQAAKPES